MKPEKFEESRRSLFRAYGFSGEVRWLPDGSDRRTYALVRDRGTVPTVLVHGGLAEASVWSLVAGRLDGTVVVVDRPGCGMSSPFDYRGVDYRKHAADWLLGVLDALDAPRANLVGNSMGGFFCMAFAAAHPERVSRLVLPGAPAGLDRDLPLFLRLWGNPIFRHLIEAMKIKDVETLRSQVFKSLVAHPEHLPDELLRIALESSQLPGAALTSRTMLNAVSNLGGWRPELSMRDAMAALDVPTLLAWGKQDQFAAPESGLSLASRMSACKVLVLEDVGHMPQLEAPARVAELVNGFCQERVQSAA